jgi:hypothetical protein
MKSWLAYVIVGTVCIYTVFNLAHWRRDGRVIAWDVVSYYGYLPAHFIYGDVTLKNPNSNFQKYRGEHIFWLQGNKDQGQFFKTTMGLSLLYAPFFLIADHYAANSEVEANGFTWPYKFAICMSTLFYLLFGMFFLRKFLIKYFEDKVVGWTLMFIVLSTNLLFYIVLGVGMPHCYIFALLSFLLYLWDQYLDKEKKRHLLLASFIIGLLVLIRPVTLLFVMFLFLWNGKVQFSLKERISLILRHKWLFILGAGIAFSTLIPQLYYWKLATGNWIQYSYSEEGFFFNDPKIIKCLFSFRKGWLIYTPIMAFALIGLIKMLRDRHKYRGLAILVILTVYFYLASTWWVWWYGGGYGLRAMIDIYAILAFPLAYFIQIVSLKTPKIKTAIFSLMILFLSYNCFQIRQVHEGLLHHDAMTFAAYKKIFLKLRPDVTPDQLEPYLDHPDYDEAIKGNRD